MKSLSLLCLEWKLFKNSNFNILFFLQNLFKCYKWKNDLEAYSIMYLERLLQFLKNKFTMLKKQLKITFHE